MIKQKKIKLLLALSVLIPAMQVYAESIPAIDCMIEPNIMVELSSPVAGVLETLTVDKSDEVKKGQLVATLKSTVEAVSMQASAERLKLSRLEHERMVELYRENVVTLSDKDRAENEKSLFELELKQAKVKLDLRQVRSPIDGIVVKRYAMPGEFVETKPILQLAQLHPLKIEVVSPVSNYGKIIKGMRARISPEFGEYKDLIATVVVVDKVIDAASGTFGIRLELDNKDYAIPGGLKCKVRFMPGMARVDDTVDTKLSGQPVVIKTITSDENIEEILMCASIGPYKKQEERSEVLDDLESEIKQTDLRTEVKIKIDYLVVSKAFNTAKEAANNMKLMAADSIADMAMLKKQNGKHRIALGLYKQKPLATARVSELNKKGYSAKLKTRKKKVNTFWADIIYASRSEIVLNDTVDELHRKSCGDNIKVGLLK
jgi:membrane fusion protein (multidrug efflux system)